MMPVTTEHSSASTLHVPRACAWLTVLLASLMVLASLGGLVIDDLYRDNALVTAAFRGNDLVSLLVAAPLMAIAFGFARRGSTRATLIWVGTLGYTLYNYAFYLFGAAFNRFFLLYVALFTLSIFALLIAVPTIDARRVAAGSTGAPARAISAFMLLFALLIGGMWIARIVGFLGTGRVPDDIVRTGHPTGVVYALDLSILVPSIATSAVLLWNRRPWGYVASIAVMVKSTTYALALMGMSFFAWRARLPGAWDLAPLFALLGVGTLAATLLLLFNLKPRKP